MRYAANGREEGGSTFAFSGCGSFGWMVSEKGRADASTFAFACVGAF